MTKNKHQTHHLQHQIRPPYGGLFVVIGHILAVLARTSAVLASALMHGARTLKQRTSVLLSKAVLIAVTAFVVPSSAVVLFLAASLLPVSPQVAHAQTPNTTINYQARILTSAGALVPDGDYNVEFKLYDSSSSGASAQGTCSLNSSTDDCWWLETRTGANKVRLVNGYISVNLGSVTAFGSSIPWSQDLYITMRVGGTGSPSWDTEMVNATTGRMKLSAVPLALVANNVRTANRTSTASDSITIQTGNTTTSGNSGSITIDTGSAAGTAGTISLGTTSASGLTLGRSGLTTSNAGALTVTQLLTGNLGATISGAAISLNDSSNFATSINGGTSTSGVTLNGGTSTGTTTLGNAASLVSVLGTIQGASPFVFEGATADAFETTFAITDPTVSDKTITFPNETGTVCTTGSVCTGYAPSTGSSSYVQLQGTTPGTQQTGHLNVSGTAIAGTSVLTPAIDVASAGALTVGNTTATSVSVCNSANCDTISLGTNADADTITIGDALDTTAINSTGWSITGAGALKVVSLDSNTATTLGVGNTTATALSLCNSAACDTLTLANNADADTITIGDSLDTFSLASTGLNVSTAGALTGVASIDTITVSATALTFAGAGTISSTGANALNLNSGANGNIALAPGGTGDLTVTTDADTNVQITASAAPGVDILAVSNSGQASTTSGVDGIAVTFSSSNASGDALHVTPAYTGGATDALTYNGFELDAFSPTNASGTDTVNGIKLGNLTDPGATITSTALNIGTGWDTILGGTTAGTNLINFTNFTVTSAGVVSGLTGLTSSGTINLSGLTASRAVFTDGSKNLVSSAASSVLLNSLTDATGSGVAVFGTSPAITTSLTTGSTSFDLLNTTATTVNAFGASTALTLGATTGTTNVRNALSLGTTSVAGSLLISDGSSSTVTLKSATQVAATNYDVSIPAITASDTFCLATASNCSAIGTAGGALTGTYPNPTLAGVSGTGAVTFQSSTTGVLSSDSSYFFYDTTNKRLGVGTATTTGNVLTVDNRTSTDSIFVAKDNGTAVLTVADGGGLTMTGTFTQTSDSATAFRLQDATGTYNNLLFDSSSNHLKIYDHTAPRTGYADIYYSGSTAVFAASSGTTQVGNGTGDVTISLTNNSEKLNFTHTGTNATSSDTDFVVTRNLTGTSNALAGNVVKIEDTSTFTSGSSAPNLLYINQNNTSATGNLIVAKTGGSTTKFQVAYDGSTTISAGSTTAFQLQNASGTALLTMDTTNSLLRVSAAEESINQYNNSNGGIGQTQNLLTYSEQFNNAAWTKTNITVSSDSVAGPDNYAGFSTPTAADTLTASASNGTAVQTYTTSTNGNYTFSVWLKTASGTQSVKLRIDSTGATPTSGTDTTVTATTTWQRYFVTQSFTGTPSNVKPTITVVTNGAAVYAYGAQLNQGTQMLVYTRTTATNQAQNQGVISNGGVVASALNATDVPLYIQGAPSQSADLFKVQSSAAADLFKISSAGDGTLAGDLTVTGGNVGIGTAASSSTALIVKTIGGSSGSTATGIRIETTASASQYCEQRASDGATAGNYHLDCYGYTAGNPSGRLMLAYYSGNGVVLGNGTTSTTSNIQIGTNGTAFNGLKSCTISWDVPSTANGASSTTQIEMGVTGGCSSASSDAVVVGISEPTSISYTSGTCNGGFGCELGWSGTGNTTAGNTFRSIGSVVTNQKFNLNFNNGSGGTVNPTSTSWVIWYIDQ